MMTEAPASAESTLTDAATILAIGGSLALIIWAGSLWVDARSTSNYTAKLAYACGYTDGTHGQMSPDFAALCAKVRP